MNPKHLLVRAAALAAVVVALSATAASATIQTYFGPAWTQQYGVRYDSGGYNYPNWNRAYRPLWYYETIHYWDGCCTSWGFKRNYDENPIVWPNPGGYAWSTCMYSDGDIQGSLDDVTCQFDA